MSRVDISGQFTFNDSVCTISTEKVQVERNAVVMIAGTAPPNWNEFCDCVDEVLRPYERIRNIIKVVAPLSFVLFIAAAVHMLLYMFGDIGDAGARLLANFLLLFFAVVNSFIFIRIVCLVNATWAEVGKICNEKSASGIGYKYVLVHTTEEQLSSSAAGCCSCKNQSQVRFIMIYEDNPDVVESPAEVFSVPVTQSSVSTSSNVTPTSSINSSENFNDSSSC